ncbi:MAG: hypothetical protein U0X71_05765 [Sphingobacteriaceae bacterium]
MQTELLTPILKTTTPSFKSQQSLSIDDLYDKLARLCETRYHALMAYPHAKHFRQRMDSVAIIRNSLAAYSNPIYGDKTRVKEALRLEIQFLKLAPSHISKLRISYVNKLEALMDACRSFLGWIKQ